ncbi:MAG: IS5 family transposase [Chitinophagales bacterium]|nr:IS5 family transposase [Chitinophagales bacterium]
MTTQYERLTDGQWEVIKEYLPVKRKRQLDLREVFNAILWITRTGAQWRNLDSSFPSWTAVYYYFYRWSRQGLLEQINRALNELERLELERQVHPSLGIVDSQSVKLAPMIYEYRGIDGHKKINGRKRQLLTDTLGRIWQASVHPANEHDSPAGVVLLDLEIEHLECLQKIVADKAYRGTFADACEELNIEFEVPHRPKGTKGFVVEAKRWVVERTIAWFNFFRRIQIDYEHTIESSVAFIYLANSSMVLPKLNRFSE